MGNHFSYHLVEDESHALELTRYIHLNAVRARMVERPEEYAWSSYQDYLALRKAPAWLDWQTVLTEIGKSRSRARLAYRGFVEAGLREPPASPLEGAVGGMFLGSREWVERWRRLMAAEPVREGVPAQRQLAWRPTVADVVETVSEGFGVEASELCVSRRHGNEARLAAIYGIAWRGSPACAKRTRQIRMVCVLQVWWNGALLAYHTPIQSWNC